jgi:hypothetical protein
MSGLTRARQRTGEQSPHQDDAHLVALQACRRKRHDRTDSAVPVKRLLKSGYEMSFVGVQLLVL